MTKGDFRIRRMPKFHIFQTFSELKLKLILIYKHNIQDVYIAISDFQKLETQNLKSYNITNDHLTTVELENGPKAWFVFSRNFRKYMKATDPIQNEHRYTIDNSNEWLKYSPQKKR